MNTITLKTSLTVLVFLMSNYLVLGQCADTSNIYTFTYNGTTYEVIKENKTWVDAALCAVERGGFLAEINDSNEQNAIYSELITNADITIDSTVAPDGGNGSYVWLGGNDLSVEGNWVWNGNNDSISTQFWMGNAITGSPVGGLYNNWGNEPDDYFGQDALGISLNGWPLGVAGEWNDVNDINLLYYIVEYPITLGVEETDLNSKIKLYPNPVTDYLTIETEETDLLRVTIYNSFGKELRVVELTKNTTSNSIDLSTLNKGIHFVTISTQSGKSITKKIVK